MKKVLSIMLVILVSVCLCACSGNNESEPQNEPEPQNDPVPAPEPEPEPDTGNYTEADFGLQFEDFDDKDLNFTDVNAQTFNDAYGMWEALITRQTDGDTDRELCLVTIFKDGSRVLMDIDSRFREEDGHRGESNHTFDLFELIEEGEHPVFKLNGMLITIDSIFEKDGIQYLFERMDIDEINEHSDIVMMRAVK
ncbi:MAG: hypothetical protein IJJ00_05230 [Erysipelotrichaceae bacterium]|nr:hypothetical protein [Erysipelotrichaceae bacterium]